jgi:hypothetical protein
MADSLFVSTLLTSLCVNKHGRLSTTVTRQTGEYKVDLTRHPKFLLAFGELASGRFPHCRLINKVNTKRESAMVIYTQNLKTLATITGYSFKIS